MNRKSVSPDPEVVRQLGLDRASGARAPWYWITAVFLIAGALIFYWLVASEPVARVRFKTAAVHVGDLRILVTATGRLQPVTQVDVGTEVSGTIQSVEVDFNDRVGKGQILARLDPDQSRAKERQSAAALALAKAQVDEARATAGETAAKLRRTRDLVAKRLASPEELDTAAAAAERASAALAVALAKVDQAQAQLDADLRTLDKTVIRSPIDGIVLNRVVQPGQTVAASLQTPVLFTLAENLTQMELKVDVDEADVGKVVEGQEAVFSVDAYPRRTFPATITQVRYAPETINGVVTFGALLAVDNGDLSLRPGMTATAEVLVQEAGNLLLVANAALRFSPPKSNSQKSANTLVGMLLPRRSHRSKGRPAAENESSRTGRVWMLRDGEPVAVAVELGLSDGVETQVLGGDVSAGDKVLIDLDRSGRGS